ncbi:MAG: C40 family peptidase [Gammaproteobacteria bacterium]
MNNRSGAWRWYTTLWLLAAASLMAGCSSAPQLPDTAPEAIAASGVAPTDAARTQAVFTAMQMVGVPYKWGGATPQGFDCSGLVQFAFASAGMHLPRTAAAQLKAVTPLTLENARAGDLLFFKNGNRTSHVAIYLGDGRFVHAPNTGNQVSIDSFGSTYWRTHFARAGRVQSGG